MALVRVSDQAQATLDMFPYKCRVNLKQTFEMSLKEIKKQTNKQTNKEGQSNEMQIRHYSSTKSLGSKYQNSWLDHIKDKTGDTVGIQNFCKSRMLQLHFKVASIQHVSSPGTNHLIRAYVENLTFPAFSFLFFPPSLLTESVIVTLAHKLGFQNCTFTLFFLLSYLKYIFTSMLSISILLAM